MNPASTRLKRGVDLPAIVALGLGTAVGVAIFSVQQPAAAVAGPGMLLAVALAAGPMFIVAVTYAFMGSGAPVTGASYEWPRRFVHPLLGFMVGWLRIAGNVAAMLVLALVLVRYLSMLAPLPTKPAMLAVFALVLVPNLLGVQVAARMQVLLMGLLVVILTLFTLWGAGSVRPANFIPFLPHGLSGAWAAAPLLVGLFFGIEAATEVGEEVQGDGLAIPLGIGLSILAAVIMYLAVSSVMLGVLGAPAVAASPAPLLSAAQRFMGPMAKPVIVGAASVSILKSLNAMYLIFSRILVAMGRTGALPPAFARVHPRCGAPQAALVAVFLGCAAGLLLPQGLTFLFLAVNVPTLFKYGAVCLSAMRMVRRHPELHAGARFRMSPRMAVGWAAAGLACSALVLLLGLGTDARPYMALGVWAVLGLGVYVAGRKGRALLFAGGPAAP